MVAVEMAATDGIVRLAMNFKALPVGGAFFNNNVDSSASAPECDQQKLHHQANPRA
jgi:hypothetical protein